MIPDESVAYATATWTRFNEAVSDELLRALCGAFAIIATADGEVAPSEVDAFIKVLRRKQEIFSTVDFAELERAFRDLSDAILSDPREGRNLALSYLSALRDDTDRCELIRSAAVIAATADEDIRPDEQTAMGEICRALGLEE